MCVCVFARTPPPLWRAIGVGVWPAVNRKSANSTFSLSIACYTMTLMNAMQRTALMYLMTTTTTHEIMKFVKTNVARMTTSEQMQCA